MEHDLDRTGTQQNRASQELAERSSLRNLAYETGHWAEGTVQSLAQAAQRHPLAIGACAALGGAFLRRQRRKTALRRWARHNGLSKAALLAALLESSRKGWHRASEAAVDAAHSLQDTAVDSLPSRRSVENLSSQLQAGSQLLKRELSQLPVSRETAIGLAGLALETLILFMLRRRPVGSMRS